MGFVVMKTVLLDCLECGLSTTNHVDDQNELLCSGCQKKWLFYSEGYQFETCPICGCKEFYRQKNFDKRIGCLIMFIAIILVPWTYGLSLPFFFAIDWFLYRRVPDMVVCYLCLGEFRGFALQKKIKAFNHTMAEGFEKKRLTQNRWSSSPKNTSE